MEKPVRFGVVQYCDNNTNCTEEIFIPLVNIPDKYIEPVKQILSRKLFNHFVYWIKGDSFKFEICLYDELTIEQKIQFDENAISGDLLKEVNSVLDAAEKVYRQEQTRAGNPVPMSISNENDKQDKVHDYCLRLELSDGGERPAIAIRHIGELYQSQVEHFRKRCLTKLKRELQNEMISCYYNNWVPNSPRLILSMVLYDELTVEQEADLDCYFRDDVIDKLESIRQECFISAQATSENVAHGVSYSPAAPASADITSIRPYPQISAKGDDVAPAFGNPDNDAAGMVVACNSARLADNSDIQTDLMKEHVELSRENVEISKRILATMQQHTANNTASDFVTDAPAAAGNTPADHSVPEYNNPNDWISLAELAQIMFDKGLSIDIDAAKKHLRNKKSDGWKSPEKYDGKNSAFGVSMHGKWRMVQEGFQWSIYFYRPSMPWITTSPKK